MNITKTNSININNIYNEKTNCHQSSLTQEEKDIFREIELLILNKKNYNQETIIETIHNPQSIQQTEPDAKYDYQVIIDLGSGKTSAALKRKYNKSNFETVIIDAKQLSNNSEVSLVHNESLEKLTHRSRLYIIGHCTAGDDTISSTEEKRNLGIPAIVNALKNIPCFQTRPETQPFLKISLVCCKGGLDKIDRVSYKVLKKSYGEKLSKALDEAGIDADIRAFTTGVQRFQPQNPDEIYTKKPIGFLQSKQPNTKVSIKTFDGVTWINPLY